MCNKKTLAYIGDVKIDLFDYINKNSSFFKKQYLDIVYDLSNYQIKNQKLKEKLKIDGYSFWEISSIQEKNIYRNSLAFKTIKYLALKDIIEKNKNKNIKIYSADYEIVRNLKEEFNFQNILYFDYKPRLADLIKRKIKITKLFHYLSFIYFFLKNCNFKNSDNIIYTKKKYFIFSHFTHYDIKKFSRKIFYPKQWAHLWELVKKDSNFLQLFIPGKKLKFYFQIDNLLRKEKIADLKSENFLNNIIFFKNFIEVIKNFKAIKSKINYSELDETLKKNEKYKFFYRINKESFFSSFSGFILLQNLLWIIVFENLFKKLPKHDYGIYLFENQPWEKILVKCWRKFNQGELIGYSHTTVNFWHLNYFNNSEYNLSNDFIDSSPDSIALSSEVSKNFLLEQSISKDKLFEVEALRYNWILDKKKNMNKKKLDNKILFLGDYEPGINAKLVDIVNKIKFDLDKLGFEITFKPHPATITKNIDRTINLNYDDIEDLVDDYSYIVSSNSTSAIIEILSCGLNAFLFIDENNFDLSPIRNTQFEKKINFFYNKEELLNKIKNTNKNEIINYYYLDKDLKKWKKKLNIN